MKAARAALTAAAVLLACAAPARANAASPAQDTWLMLSVSHGQTPSASEGSTMLRCEPPGGDHRRAAEACAELAAANGRIADIPPKDAFCPMIYAPVTAHAHGMWHNRAVEYTETFANTCMLTARTGAVFAPLHTE